ncbi:hypothetical protein BJ085DRAFT_40273 [Dimargaris cristalligena]|uniref:Uncharacterized protein n=1 Tax=Dimargaris cristalligena TaxID=215637 RepID=A0A4P9ZJK5_9FUNG|nr:hypothetical protein BJ085DRAFT_40273 [Dimargaris cristalligena]|eukprot:RKP33397.1 hypothetical protein BJ085DRAFT_40273 [Dimargaris cristalligena]
MANQSLIPKLSPCATTVPQATAATVPASTLIDMTITKSKCQLDLSIPWITSNLQLSPEYWAWK